MTVLQEIEDLRQKLRYYSDKYYNDDAPEIEDYQYDMMMRRLESLEQANPRYVSPDSPTQKVQQSDPRRQDGELAGCV